MKTSQSMALFVVMWHALAGWALAQTTFGTITGTVTDASGASVPGASVEIRHEDTNAVRVLKTDLDGNFLAPSLLPGPYSVAVEAPGFQRQVRSGLRLPVNASIRVDFTLRLGQVQETVEVTGEVPLLNTTSATVGTVISNATIVNMPLNGRQFTQLLLLVPGTTPRQGPAANNNLSGISPSVNGGRPQNNNFTLDGADNNESFFNSFAISPSVDALEEFKVQTHIASAEFGKAAGANINISLRSGTNQLHGVAYHYLRNDKLDARNPFQPVRGAFKQNQFGGTLGGPVVIPRLYHGRDRSFFFFAAEGFRMRKGLTPPQSTVPTPAQLRGDLSGGPAIFDPWTTQRNPANPSVLTRAPFPGNQIPAERIHRASRIIAEQFYPAPNLLGVPGVNLVNAKSQRQDDDQWHLRVDHRVSAQNNLFARFSLNNRERSAPTSLPRVDTTLFNRNRNFLLSDTHLFGPTSILDVKLAFNRTYIASYNTPQNPDALFRQTGIQGYVIQSNQFPMFPIITISGFASIAQDASLTGPLNNYQYLVSFTKIAGRHAFKTGADIRRQQYFGASYRAGTIGFDSVPTRDPQNPARTGQSLASFLLGLPSSARRIVGDTSVRMRSTNYHFYLQDDIRLTPKLIMNLGLRYEYNQLPYEKRGRLSGVDLRNGNLFWAATNPITGEPPNIRPSIIDPDWNNFAPRFGLAYTLGDRTTIRAGYGIFYNSNFLWELQGPRGQWPFALEQNETGLNVEFPERPFDNLFPQNPASVISFGITSNIRARTGYSHQWNLAVQRQLPGNLALEAAYVGAAAHKLFTLWRENAAVPGPGPLAPRRRFPQFGTISETNSRANSNYNAFQFKAEKRYSRGLTLLAAYTYGKSIDDASAYLSFSQHNPFRLRDERGRSDYDVEQTVVVSYAYELPLGPGKRFLGRPGRFARLLLGDWQISGITSLRSGFPIKIVIPTDNASTGVTGGQRPNLVGRLQLPAKERTTERWFNTQAVAMPPIYTFGDLGRNAFSGPGFVNFDFGAYKTFPLTEKHRLQFRAEFFNIFNTVNLSLPGATMNTAAFGKINSTSTDARDIQFALRYQF